MDGWCGMYALEDFLRISGPGEIEGTDQLLDIAGLVRELIEKDRYQEISALIRHLIESSLYEAFSWTMALLEEAFEEGFHAAPDGFVCDIGRSVKDYDLFIETLGADMNAIDNKVYKDEDENGEVRSFFNTCTYKTQYDHIYLLSSENFDAKDNDYIEYGLLFAKEKPL